MDQTFFVLNPKIVQLFKVTTAANSPSIVLTSFLEMMEFSILDKNKPCEVLISNINGESTRAVFHGKKILKTAKYKEQEMITIISIFSDS